VIYRISGVRTADLASPSRMAIQVDPHRRLRGELLTLKAQHDEARRAAMSEAEARVAVERAHESLVRQWRQQLEAREAELTAMQAQLAPPRDLEQLKAQLADEMAAPYAARQAALEGELETNRAAVATLTRQLEALRVEHAAFTADQSAEAEAAQEAHRAALSAVHASMSELQAAMDDQAREHASAMRSLRGQLAEATSRAASAAAEVTDLRRALEDAVRRADEATMTLQREHTQALSAQLSLEADAAAYKRRAIAAEEQAAALTAAHTESTARCAALTLEVSNMQNKLVAASRALDSTSAAASSQLEDVTAEHRSALDRAHAVAAALQAQLSDVSAERDAATAAARRLAAELGDDLGGASGGGTLLLTSGSAMASTTSGGTRTNRLQALQLEVGHLQQALGAERARTAAMGAAAPALAACLQRLRTRSALRSSRHTPHPASVTAASGGGGVRGLGGIASATSTGRWEAAPSDGSGIGWGGLEGGGWGVTASGPGGGGVGGNTMPQGESSLNPHAASAGAGDGVSAGFAVDVGTVVAALGEEVGAAVSEFAALAAEAASLRQQWGVAQRALADITAERDDAVVSVDRWGGRGGRGMSMRQVTMPPLPAG